MLEMDNCFLMNSQHNHIQCTYLNYTPYKPIFWAYGRKEGRTSVRAHTESAITPRSEAMTTISCVPPP